MTTRLLAALTLALAMIFTASPAMADKGGNGHGNGNGQGNPHGNPHQNGNAQGKEHGNSQGKHANVKHEGWDHRGDYEYRTYAVGSTPPGWSKGQKTGWGNCGMPPGQAKKYGCQRYVYQGVPYYYYRDEVGQIFVRRPFIEIHAGVDVAY